MNTERILPKILFLNWRDKLILTQWNLRILEQGMNSPDENKLYFTKDWQLENEHFVILVSEVFKSWNNWRGNQEFRLEEFSRRRRMVENHFKDVESVRSGEIFHVPNQPAFSSSSWTRKTAEPRLKFAAKFLGYALFFRKRFWMVHMRSTSTSYSRNAQFKGFLCYGKYSVQASNGKPVTESGDRDHNQSWAKMAKSQTVFNFHF